MGQDQGNYHIGLGLAKPWSADILVAVSKPNKDAYEIGETLVQLDQTNGNSRNGILGVYQEVLDKKVGYVGNREKTCQSY